MTARLLALLLLLGACTPAVAPVESSRIPRGTALPPPGLDAPATR